MQLMEKITMKDIAILQVDLGLDSGVLKFI